MLRTSAQVSGHPWTGHGGETGLLSQAASQEPATWLTTARQPPTRVPQVRAYSSMVGDTGFEPVTSFVSSIPRPFVDVRGRQAERDPVPQNPPKSVRTHLRCQAVSQARASGAEPRLLVGATAMAGRDPPVCTLALKWALHFAQNDAVPNRVRFQPNRSTRASHSPTSARRRSGCSWGRA